MEGHSPERLLPFDLDLIIRRGLGRTLLFCFLGIAIVPMVLVGFISYKTAYHRLEREIRKNIRIAAELKSRELQVFFDGRLADADRQGREPTMVSFFSTLTRRHAATEETVADFIHSSPWATAASADASAMTLHANLHGYSDILLIDATGNVLFSSAKPHDLASNLNQDGVAKTGFAAAFRRTLESGNPEFVGFDSYSPAGGAKTALVTAAIRAQDSRPIGVIAFKIPISTVNQLLTSPTELGAGSRVYLVGSDLTLLAGTLSELDFKVGAPVDSAQTQSWRENLTGGHSESTLPVPFIYAGPGGKLVMGTYAEIHQGNPPPHALIVEIETQTAFGALNRLRAMILTIVILTCVAVFLVCTALTRIVVTPVRDLSQSMLMVTKGRFDHVFQVTANNEIGELAATFGNMARHFKAVKVENETQSRLLSGLASLHRLIDGDQAIRELSLNTLEFLCEFLNLRQADFFVVNGDGGLEWASRFPGHPNTEDQQVFFPGDGRVGQAALGKTITLFQKDAVSGLLASVPAVDLANLILVPIVIQETTKGVLELEKTGAFSRFDGRFLEVSADVIAAALSAAMIRQHEASQLERTREKANKLKVRETVLEANNRRLQSQRLTFQASEEKLQLKQLELEAANAQMVKNAADLETHMITLETQKFEMEQQNTALEKAHRELAEKARQLEISSRYKTEFMANMSHELKTPLNCIQLLSRLLLENKEKTLTSRQSEFAQTIHSAGNDLLNLINEILDLAKVESGKMEVALQVARVESIARAMQASFAPLAEQSGVVFSIHVAPDVPDQLLIDRKRIEQIVKNFLSNAFKFTTRGTIQLEIAVSREPGICQGAGDSVDNGSLAISVTDTGIGIPADKQQMVFDAFQQVDGSTRRKYGGTGLGLSISRELARLMEGQIRLESEQGRGSRFTLYLPIIPPPDKEPAIILSDTFKSSDVCHRTT